MSSSIRDVFTDILAAGTALFCALNLPASAHSALSRVVPAPSVSVVSATKSAVALSWSSDAAGTKSVVERKVLGSAWPAPGATAPMPASIATVDGTSFNDNTIAAFTTYVYRIRALSSAGAPGPSSNEVIVGPPPVGFSSVIAAPTAMQAHDPSQFANTLGMAFDSNGDPMLAYVTYDLNNDGENPDTDLSVMTWNRARYRWNAPVSIDTVGNVSRSGNNLSFSLARDESTGLIGVLYLKEDHELKFATSSDGGATFRATSVLKRGAEESGLASPALAFAAGRVHIAFAEGTSAVQYRVGAEGTAPSTWSAKSAPKIPGASEYRGACVNVGIDAAGAAGVTYCMSAESGYNLLLGWWRPESGSVTKIGDSNNKQNDDPGIALHVNGSTIAVAFLGARDEQFFADHHYWFTRSADGGKSFGPLVVVADDGANAMGSPLSVAVDKSNHFAITGNVTGGSEGNVKCGQPKLMRSTDGAAWTTCAPDTKGLLGAGDPMSAVGAFAANDKLYIAVKTRQSAGALAPGIVLWRER